MAECETDQTKPYAKGEYNKFDEEVYRLLIKIIENKRSQKEKHTIENIKVLDNFIETQLKIDEAPNKRHFHLPEYFNDVIIKYIFNKGYKDENTG